MSLFGKFKNGQTFKGSLNFIFLKFHWFMKSKNFSSRQALLQTDENLPDKGSLGKVPENLDSDLVLTVLSLLGS